MLFGREPDLVRAEDPQHLVDGGVSSGELVEVGFGDGGVGQLAGIDARLVGGVAIGELGGILDDQLAGRADGFRDDVGEPAAAAFHLQHGVAGAEGREGENFGRLARGVVGLVGSGEAFEFRPAGGIGEDGGVVGSAERLAGQPAWWRRPIRKARWRWRQVSRRSSCVSSPTQKRGPLNGPRFRYALQMKRRLVFLVTDQPLVGLALD